MVSLRYAFLLIRIHFNIKSCEPDERLKRFGCFNCLHKEMNMGFRSHDVYRSLYTGDIWLCLPSVKSTLLVNLGNDYLKIHYWPSVPWQSRSCFWFALTNLNNLFDSFNDTRGNMEIVCCFACYLGNIAVFIGNAYITRHDYLSAGSLVYMWERRNHYF